MRVLFILLTLTKNITEKELIHGNTIIKKLYANSIYVFTCAYTVDDNRACLDVEKSCVCKGFLYFVLC